MNSTTYKTLLLLLFNLFVFFSARSQLCTGSLGDPIVNITFGGGSNPGPQLSAAAIGYQYFLNDCPPDGGYTIRNNTTNCFSNSWHGLVSDHTGNGNGYFMLVNASNLPGDFYVDTVRGLCSGTTYQFSAFLMNMLLPASCGGNGIQPDITFSIERTNGTVIAQYNSGSMVSRSSPTWVQQGFYFVTPANVSDVVLRLRNNAPGGCGNDLALDDIIFRPCGPILNTSFNNGSQLYQLCEGDTATIFMQGLISSGYTDPRYQWQQSIGGVWTDIAGATNPTHTVFFDKNKLPGDHVYRLTAFEAANAGKAACRVASSMLTVRVNPKPTLSIGNPGPVCVGDNVSITASGASQYQWSGPAGFTSTAATIYLNAVSQGQAGYYKVAAVGSNSCRATDSTMLVVNAVPAISVGQNEFEICAGSSVQLVASGANSYAWSPAIGLSSATTSSPMASPKDTTDYRVIGFNAAGCSDTAFVKVNVQERPVAQAGADRVITEGESIQLKGSISGSYTDYTWSPAWRVSDVNILEPMVYPVQDTNYVLTAFTNGLCPEDADSVFIRVLKKIIAPNVFTPNGDGINDLWEIAGLNTYKKAEVKVYNGYGQLVFHASHFSPWNGRYKNKPLPVGTYYYIIETGETKRLTGYVDILR
jgi:gliding motility-associated-like protein